MQLTMKNLLKFLQSSSGENSSKRLAFLLSILIACYGVINTSGRLIDSDNPELAVDLWQSFFIFVAFLGGFVTAELLIKLVEIIKNAKSRSNITVNSNSSDIPSEFHEGKE